jgi:hypothetical protein
MSFDKRGIGHIEIIMSFVMFILFLGFAFYFFSPFQSGRTMKSSLDYVFDEIVQEASITLESYSVVLEGGCGVVNISSETSGKVLIFDKDGNSLGGLRELDSFCGFGNPEGFITILISEEFPQNAGPCPALGAPCSNISSSNNEFAISNKSFYELVVRYDSDYFMLKDDFNIGVDFAFSLVFDDGTGNFAEKEVPANLEVLSNKDRVKVITTEGFVFADLIVKVW